MKLGLFWDIYKTELERHDRLTSHITLPVGVLTLLGGAIWGMATDYPWSREPVSVVFGAFLTVTLIGFFTTSLKLSFVFWSFKGRFHYLDYPPKLVDWHHRLEEHYSGLLGTDESDAQREFERGLSERLAAASAEVAEWNDRRSEHLYWARCWLLLTVGLTMLAALLYAVISVLEGPAT